jgi:hypothetical protein
MRNSLALTVISVSTGGSKGAVLCCAVVMVVLVLVLGSVGQRLV